eukprot:6189467-Pleurochrysis_carterae.AAC.3
MQGYDHWSGLLVGQLVSAISVYICLPCVCFRRPSTQDHQGSTWHELADRRANVCKRNVLAGSGHSQDIPPGRYIGVLLRWVRKADLTVTTKWEVDGLIDTPSLH